MNAIIFKTHLVSVILFLLIYLVKTILLLSNRKDDLARLTKTVKVPEMIISFLFLGTGIFLLISVPVITPLLIIKLVCVFVSIPLAIIGFKKGNKFLAAFSLILIIAAYGLAEMHKKKVAGPAISKTETDGKNMYSQKCVSCHGEDGKTGLGNSADLSASILDPLSAAELIKNGKGTMPGFKDQLSEEQVMAVVDYIQTMKAK